MTTDSTNGDAAFAFALVCAAGGATGLGASVVFFPSLVKLASKRVLASSLGFSAGVMLYVSFVEIFLKSVGSFEREGRRPENTAHIYGTLCFFLGCFIMVLLDIMVKKIGGYSHGHETSGEATNDLKIEVTQEAPHCVGCSTDPIGDLKGWHEKAQAEEERKRAMDTVTVSKASSKPEGDECAGFDDVEDVEDNSKASIVVGTPKTVDDYEAKNNAKLVRMGMNTAIAIALHNFPEGLATFVATLADPNVGAVLAIAIGIHNVPEGLCVALPIYYATGNRRKAFLWGVLSGLSEPVAALLGWAILANHFTDDVYAVMFGVVAGMMVVISLKELIPTAHRYDPQDTVVTYSAIVGMAVMSLSLCMFIV
eukprot:CAMPEP_0194352520 /NCGR_PEP_ID=MMETSP0174-20130528/938_1 /TAXON_ID=216777 /ORGANISM="Proboscia alata, Strain PI-D3" /LENGTH=366 /DNA_ID=CAMNT_0039120629 /DNA_START=88 /DNA_END=1188 /DNA_ORIENTATION=+